MPLLTDLDETDSDGLLWLCRGDVDAQIGAGRVTMMCTDDGGTEADETILFTMLAKAEQKVCSILRRAYRSIEEIQLVMSQDQFSRSASADIAAEYMSRRKGDFQSEDGKGRYYQPFKEAIEHFEKMSHGRTETNAKGVTNAQEGGTQLPKVQPQSATFTFAPEKGFRGPPTRGGF